MIYTLKQEFKHIENKEVEEKFKNVNYEEFCEILELFKIKKFFFSNLENIDKYSIKFDFQKDDFINFYIYDIKHFQEDRHRLNIFYYIESTGEEIKFFTDEEIKIMKEYKINYRNITN